MSSDPTGLDFADIKEQAELHIAKVASRDTCESTYFARGVLILLAEVQRLRERVEEAEWSAMGEDL